MTTNDNDEVSLKEYIDIKINSMERAVDVASQGMNKRLEGMNEFRQQLKDQTNTFLTRNEYETKHTLLADKISDLRESRAEMAGKASQKSVNITLLISILGLVIGLVSILHSLIG